MGLPMKTRNRVERLLEQARVIAKTRRRTIRGRQCQNATWDELCEMVVQSILPESQPILGDIMRQVEDYQQRPPRALADGTTAEDVHGFVQWLQGLSDGWAALPETIPHVVLLAWRNDYVRRREEAQRLLRFGVGDGWGGTPVPVWRCEDCHMVLPNCTPDSFGGF